MRQLLEIETVPIKIETKTTFGRFEPSSDPSEKQSAYDGQLRTATSYASTAPAAPVASTATQTAGAVTSAPQVTRTNISDVYSSGQNSQVSFAQAQAYESASGTPNSSDVTNAYVSAGVQNQAMAIASQQSSTAVRSTVPAASNYVTSTVAGAVQSADQSTQAYTQDRANFQAAMELGNVSFEYISGGVEFNVIQQPKVNFTYVGDPIYVPKSADPNYVEVEQA